MAESPIQEPMKGQRITASWGRAVTRAVNAFGTMSAPGMMIRDGAGYQGAEPIPTNPKATPSATVSEALKAYKVKWIEETDDDGEVTDDFWAIYLPSDSLCIIDGNAIPIKDDLADISEDHGEGWYSLDEVIGETNGTLFLDVYLSTKEDDEEEDPQVAWNVRGEDDEPDEIEDFKRYSFAIAGLDVTESGDTKTATVTQIQEGPIITSAVQTDEKSVDFNDSGDLEIAHFDDEERDETEALSEKITVDTETGEVTIDDEATMLVARKGGKLVYIPLTPGGGHAEDEDDDEDDDGCKHPGDESDSNDEDDDGGVASESSDHPGDSRDVAVSPDDHTGDSGCCNQPHA